ncbi:hypothetical protein HPP92_000368 [Vanilla planifolia]|uniref:DUF679 domain membrane protein 2 n=1 Tax=Vanilla planifolia TaxID=51239 RepID=A0A835S5I8_VANPL|nr:hypothetical protein HPP92_000368 [Vanilla planifolia]
MASKSQTVGDKIFESVGDLIKLLPSGTVFAYQFLNPLVTNHGRCNRFEKVLDVVLLIACGLSCAFSCFTDSYVAADGRVYYGIVTPKGLHPFSDPDAAQRDLSGYRLRPADFVHAAVSVAVLATVAVLDSYTVACLFPGLVAAQPMLVKVLPAAVGAVASGVFVAFPNKRHGIGYPPETGARRRRRRRCWGGGGI